MSERVPENKLKKSIESKTDNILNQACITNTHHARQQLIRIAHYCNLLQKHGNAPDNISKVYNITSKCIEEAVESREKHRDLVDFSLIDEHTRTWNMAMYYYERGQKSLCQMMITTMDYILQEKAGMTILYKGADRASYYNYIDEMNDLNSDYLDAVYFESAYDYCTERLAEYVRINEYKELAMERKLTKSGMPDRVKMSIDSLKEIAGKDKAEYFVDMKFNLHSEYNLDFLKKAYRESTCIYKDEEEVMSVFTKVVVDTAEKYIALLKRC